MMKQTVIATASSPNIYYAPPNSSTTIGNMKDTNAAHIELSIIAIPITCGFTIYGR